MDNSDPNVSSNKAVQSQEDNLKKVVGLGGAISVASGQVIGAGIMALMGIAIGMTGGSVVFAFILASIIVIIAAMPIAFMGSTLPTTGGLYRYTSRIISPRFGFFYLLVFLVGQITIAMYALSFAEYFMSIVPGLNVKVVAVIILTVLYLFNVFGVKSATKLQSIMMILLISSLLIFIFYGFPKVDFSNFSFSSPTLFTGGAQGFFTATALLTFAAGGAVVIAEMGGELKNPGKDIPIAIIVSTFGIGIIYALMAIVAAGVLPLEETAFQPLTNVSRAILPTPLFYYFVVCGAMTALATTLNAVFSWVTKGILVACEDGWLPRKFGVVNRKYGSPHWILTFFYIVGLIPILTGLSLEFISSIGNAAIQVANILPIIAAMLLPIKFPEAYAKSQFRIGKAILKVMVVIAVILQFVQGYFLMSGKPVSVLVTAVVYILAAYAYTVIRYKKASIEFIREF